MGAFRFVTWTQLIILLSTNVTFAETAEQLLGGLKPTAALEAGSTAPKSAADAKPDPSPQPPTPLIPGAGEERCKDIFDFLNSTILTKVEEDPRQQGLLRSLAFQSIGPRMQRASFKEYNICVLALVKAYTQASNLQRDLLSSVILNLDGQFSDQERNKLRTRTATAIEVFTWTSLGAYVALLATPRLPRLFGRNKVPAAPVEPAPGLRPPIAEQPRIATTQDPNALLKEVDDLLAEIANSRIRRNSDPNYRPPRPANQIAKPNSNTAASPSTNASKTVASPPLRRSLPERVLSYPGTSGAAIGIVAGGATFATPFIGDLFYGERLIASDFLQATQALMVCGLMLDSQKLRQKAAKEGAILSTEFDPLREMYEYFTSSDSGTLFLNGYTIDRQKTAVKIAEKFPHINPACDEVNFLQIANDLSFVRSFVVDAANPSENENETPEGTPAHSGGEEPAAPTTTVPGQEPG